MKTKPKQIRATKVLRELSWNNETGKINTEVLYWFRQSDIRALAGQMVRDIDEVFNRFEGREAAVLEALKRAGMTPGKGAK